MHTGARILGHIRCSLPLTMIPCPTLSTLFGKYGNATKSSVGCFGLQSLLGLADEKRSCTKVTPTRNSFPALVDGNHVMHKSRFAVELLFRRLDFCLAVWHCHKLRFATGTVDRHALWVTQLERYLSYPALVWNLWLFFGCQAQHQ